ncbi:MAG: hypothetical protein B6I22_01570 [Desulfobacteraceae bacterium 4572_123]|nr:MAG: hypothetical protein B6I22_01570 [Desulfobacteraceae bacterium 4572_123]
MMTLIRGLFFIEFNEIIIKISAKCKRKVKNARNLKDCSAQACGIEHLQNPGILAGFIAKFCLDN